MLLISLSLEEKAEACPNPSQSWDTSSPSMKTTASCKPTASGLVMLDPFGLVDTKPSLSVGLLQGPMWPAHDFVGHEMGEGMPMLLVPTEQFHSMIEPLLERLARSTAPHIVAYTYVAMISSCNGVHIQPITRVLVEFVVNEAFDKKRNHDMRGIKETQKFKLGDAQGTPR